jgi:alpha-ketoglutarate-dependent taurine dioxygenase
MPQQPTLRPLSAHVGTQVSGIDLRRPLANDIVQALKDAFSSTRLLLIRDQDIGPDDQARFARHFGEIEIRTGYAALGETAPPEISTAQHVSNTRADGILGDGELNFHGDHYWHAEPLTALILYAIEVPEKGGETRFCNSGAAFEAMPAQLRARLESLRCTHMYDFKGDYKKRHDPARIGQPGVFAHTHPLVWRDKVSGKPAIWFNPNSTACIEGLADAEVASTAQDILEYVNRPQFSYEHRWRAGDLLIWDNRMLLHARAPFDPTARRTLRRTPLLERRS